MTALRTDIDAMAALLEQHEAEVTGYDAGDIWGCFCGWTCQGLPYGDRWGEYHRHVAQKVLEALE